MHWPEFKSAIHFKLLSTKRRLKKHFTWHAWRLDHEIMTKKCCHNKREEKRAQQKEGNKKGNQPEKRLSWQVDIPQNELRNLLKTEAEKKRSRNARKIARRKRAVAYKEKRENSSSSDCECGNEKNK